MAQSFFVITRQPLQLDRCSNLLRMRKVFLVLFLKKFWLGWGVRLGWARKVGVFSVFWPTLTGPGRQSHGPKFWRKLFLGTTQSLASIEPLLDLLACLEPKLWPKNSILPQNQKIAENAWVSHWLLVSSRYLCARWCYRAIRALKRLMKSSCLHWKKTF